MKEGCPKILIADDVPEVRQLLRLVLEPYYDVIAARNGEEAWELFNAEKPDLVICDVVMPRIDGVELCRRIKWQSFAPETPVIIVTAVTKDRELPDNFWKQFAGSDGFITKPFSPVQVLAMVRKLLADGCEAPEHDPTESHESRGGYEIEGR
ncbi:MAG: hypothetical protein KatS3mg130_1371 [Candidatus Sumerlaea sp.]|uniref:Two-component response regulator n=1 Tax=Sumerlaea chitinivorans TaxID=2250252 RepID=A0A2Z4Y4S4_SUMC1|nr:Two-component response regulator [Candidatus Sumerlaea chitinivorans]GIX44963.1 MAG: hypothetical protein KatS3mg130_1371 [Candidatus Sumerlaea sp.]